ncbi:hypothetical protein K0U91_15135 [Chryseobacterium chendengshani]|uniref:hypothetical protein n=1 Tax=Chryseobacterium sp. LJ668 TaxID=2864040 RepID=UPI001C68C7A2|nr:hypothetical protein [Chryseobacterium sp. LJ668]MBW8522843.1 hypothetical protein [Chryseobacterium sp. LJ668]QYK16375.1 hypothetical protein K0U91_15135 [Chryseobacterium sp. LJ668]
MKKLITIIVVIISTSLFSQNKPFTNLVFDQVIIYDFEGGKGSESMYIIGDNGKLSKNVKKQVVLDQKTIKILNTKLESKLSYGAGTASCFEPHLGIVYYFKNKLVAHISVCLDCNRLQSSKNIIAQNQGRIGTGKDSYYLLDGMSKSFRIFQKNNCLIIANL